MVYWCLKLDMFNYRKSGILAVHWMNWVNGSSLRRDRDYACLHFLSRFDCVQS